MPNTKSYDPETHTVTFRPREGDPIPVSLDDVEEMIANGSKGSEIADFYGVEHTTFMDNPAIKRTIRIHKSDYRMSRKAEMTKIAQNPNHPKQWEALKYILDRVGMWDDERDTETADESNAPQPLIFAQPVYDIDSIPEHIKEQIRKENK